MAKNDFRPYVFMISGGIVMALFAGLRYAVSDEFGFFSLMLTFLYGGLLGTLAASKHTSFLKNMAFFSFFFFVLWALFVPIESVGGVTVIKNVEFWTIGLIFIIFLEREVLNSIARARDKKQSMAPAFIGSIMLLVLLSVTGVSKQIGMLFERYWYVAVVVLLAWFTVLYFLIGKGLQTTGGKITKWLGR